jgi:hypothetical protein
MILTYAGSHGTIGRIQQSFPSHLKIQVRPGSYSMGWTRSQALIYAVSTSQVLATNSANTTSMLAKSWRVVKDNHC